MNKINNLEELIDGEYYWMHSKMVYENGERSSQMLIQCYRDAGDGRAYFGDHIWAYDGNNQAMEKYDIYGPVPKPEVLNRDEENDNRIFKRLLMEVFEFEKEPNEILRVAREGNNIILRHRYREDTIINIYELAHKCKQWARKNGIELLIFGSVVYIVWDEFDSPEFVFENYKSFVSRTVENAIFNACIWIYKETKNLKN